MDNLKVFVRVKPIKKEDEILGSNRNSFLKIERNSFVNTKTKESMSFGIKIIYIYIIIHIIIH